jgi:large subunit ribosomal protein L25
MDMLTVQAQPRSVAGKGSARQLRRDGVTPAILYGGDGGPASLQVDSKEFVKVLHTGGEHAVVRLEVADNADISCNAMVKGIQWGPVKGELLHIDFLRIRIDEKIQTVVPVVTVGQAPGVTEGGLADQQLREVDVECLPLDVPEELRVDISSMGIGDSLHVSDLDVPGNVTVLTEAERAIITIVAPRLAVEEEEEAEAEEGAEPELVEAGGDEEAEGETE